MLFKNAKRRLNSYLLSKLTINGDSVDSYIENEAQRRSKHWQEEKDELAKALQAMHQQNSTNLNKARELEAIIAGEPNKKQLFDEYLKQLVESGGVIIDASHDRMEAKYSMKGSAGVFTGGPLPIIPTEHLSKVMGGINGKS